MDRDVDMALMWFETGKDIGNLDRMYNYAMMHLGWMVTELNDIPAEVTANKFSACKTLRSRRHEVASLNQRYMTHHSNSLANGYPRNYSGPSTLDYITAVQQLQQAVSKGHLQAKHKLGMLYATGAIVNKKNMALQQRGARTADTPSHGAITLCFKEA